MENYELDWHTFARLRGKGLDPPSRMSFLTGINFLLAGLVVWMVFPWVGKII